MKTTHYSESLVKGQSILMKTKSNETIEVIFSGMRSDHQAKLDLILSESVTIDKQNQKNNKLKRGNYGNR